MKKSVILCFCNVVLSLVLTLACIQAVPVQASPLQSKTITGVITSGTDGFPLIGVSVQVQENSTGSITDLDGRYSVQASEGQTLVFSYIGFKSQTIKIGTSSIINVVLIEKVSDRCHRPGKRRQNRRAEHHQSFAGHAGTDTWCKHHFYFRPTG